MSTSRAREIWRNRASGEAYLVEVEGERVVSAEGPLAEDELTRDSLSMRRAAQGRSPGYTEESVELERSREDFERERLDI